ncbi:kinase-like protein [Aspergillus saccharolyticus JOP 1030-1]|uniref:non-specific serine/threonine protein kinase n=1 Tax=Aspergillus saccharolyticus JOP 1030-1 TaxID=1450539 RepID=A0A318ZQU5_9EURO|nr:kinase-like protein [Aspergillus saccharolyticus JOP 1030-1]PYH46733.1 kinase-like protein [Aspergillus saccharolyticus JOP 1030-1]
MDMSAQGLSDIWLRLGRSIHQDRRGDVTEPPRRALLPSGTSESTHVALKVYVSARGVDHELNVYNRMQSIETDHPGTKYVRKLLNHFSIRGPHGRHVCLVHEVLGMSLLELGLIGSRLGVIDPVPRLEQAKGPLRNFIYALDNLHRVPQLIHTKHDLKTRRTDYIYIMPNFQRAPEVILHLIWDYKVASWGLEMLAWDLASTSRFITNHTFDGQWDDGAHLAELVALLGHPPIDFVRRVRFARLLWDDDGNWTNLVPIPERSLEQAAADIKGDEVEGFLRWLRRALQWDPKVRPTVSDLLMDPWLMKGLELQLNHVSLHVSSATPFNTKIALKPKALRGTPFVDDSSTTTRAYER